MKSPLIVVFGIAALHACSSGKQSGSAAHEPSQSKPAAAEATSAHEDEPKHEPLPRRFRLDPTVLADAKIRTIAVMREALAATVDLPGEIASDPDHTARVSTLVGGRIESVTFQEGQPVKKGDVLAIIKVPELGKARAAYTAAAAKATAARSNADRLQGLSEKRLSGSQEVMAAKAESDALQAEAGAAEANLRALGIKSYAPDGSSQLALRAPISGVIIARDAIVGQPVTSDQVIASVCDLTNVWFLGRVFEKSLGKIQIGAAAEVTLNAYPKESFIGSVEYLGSQIDPAARTITARIRLRNRGGLLRIGLFGVARVGTDSEEPRKPPAIVVPRGAVTEVADKSVVFVHEPDGDFDMHDVVLGEGALGRVQVLSGLREGEQVVVEGVFALKSTVLKSTFGEDE